MLYTKYGADERVETDNRREKEDDFDNENIDAD